MLASEVHFGDQILSRFKLCQAEISLGQPSPALEFENTNFYAAEVYGIFVGYPQDWHHPLE